MQQLQLMRMQMLQHLRGGLRVIETVTDVVFLIALALSANSTNQYTFKFFNHFVESIIMGCIFFQVLLIVIGNSTCTTLLLAEPLERAILSKCSQAAVHVEDFTHGLISTVQGGQSFACDKAAHLPFSKYQCVARI